MPARRRKSPAKRRKARPFLRLALGLLSLVVVFCAAAGATFWLAESSGLLSVDQLEENDVESITPEEREALEKILNQSAPKQP
jgi:hypothetical protein